MGTDDRGEPYLRLEGEKPLNGSVLISGGKNACLPIIAASILAGDEVVLSNVPRLADVDIMLHVLRGLGATAVVEDDTLTINTRDITNYSTPFELMNKMRASIYVMGPLLSRFKQARVAMPGGCAIGSRPINFHLAGFEQMGVNMSVRHGDIDARCECLKGSNVFLDIPSVGATANLMMAASLADGETVIENAAEEPHIVDLAWFLKSMGARIRGEGSKTIVIDGVARLHGATHRMIPDQIEAGTFMIAGAITRGSVTLEGMRVADLKPIIVKLREAGVTVTEGKNSLKVSTRRRPRAINITTLPHPGFPTDMQPQMMALLSCSEGISVIKETVWENRFMHIAELARMGADINVQGHTAFVNGVSKLTGAKVVSTDLRAGAALVLAGLVAENTTIVYGLDHIDRGYENFEEKLRGLGADIQRYEPQKNNTNTSE